ncbi:MAG: SusD/RagB family nutrient-binding outer membrane lipoprotein [Chitinophagaceae bacterium]|nr:SusD/RagB family nutrient-binding outer membrane lipoprotein [Chitinophagaceae bacterium]
MKKYSCLILSVFILGACTKNFQQINTDPISFPTASPEAIMNNVFKRTNDVLAYKNQEICHWIYLTRIGGGRYDVSDAGFWQNMYVNVLENIQQVFNQYGKDTGFVNRVQIARIWQSYVYSMLTANYGPIPTTQANNINNLTTVMFESEDSVYLRILSTLKDAAARIDPAKDKMAYDVIYNGDLLKWKKFANTLRLRIALRCMKNLGSVATGAVQEVMADEANTISLETETAKMAYENVSGNEHPFWRTEIKPYTKRDDLPKLSDYLLNFFRAYKDPRLYTWYDSVPLANRATIQDTLTSVNDDSLRVVVYPLPYYGIPKAVTPNNIWTLPSTTPPGVPSGPAITTYSTVSGNIFGTSASSVAQAARPILILNYAESNFLKAEAAMLGLGGSKSAEQYYTAGIDATFAYWGVSSTARDAYKAVPGIHFGTSGTGFANYLGMVRTDIPADDLSKIWIQEWLNYWPDQSMDFWCLQRRTQVLQLPPHTNPTLTVNTLYVDVPLRGAYLSTTNSLNPDGYKDALSKLGVGTLNEEQYNPYIALHFVKPFTPINWAAVPVNYDLSYLEKWYGNTIEELKAAAQASGFTYSISNTYKP